MWITIHDYVSWAESPMHKNTWLTIIKKLNKNMHLIWYSICACTVRECIRMDISITNTNPLAHSSAPTTKLVVIPYTPIRDFGVKTTLSLVDIWQGSQLSKSNVIEVIDPKKVLSLLQNRSHLTHRLGVLHRHPKCGVQQLEVPLSPVHLGQNHGLTTHEYSTKYARLASPEDR